MNTCRALPGFAAPSVGYARNIVMRMRTGIVATLAIMVFALLAAVPSHAQTASRPDLSNIITPPKINQKSPMLLQADQMIYDNAHNRVIAKGNVEIYYGNYTLLANRVIYDRNANTLSAVGNVRIKDPSGAIITSNQMTLTDDFRDGFVEALKYVTSQDTRIVAQSATREAGNVTVFHNGWFTPCKPCATDPSKAPTWRIRAKKIVHQKDKATITFHDAAFDLFGVPIAWVPYFKTADSTVKRKTGFLIPSFGHSSQLGSTFTVPYYFALSDHYDFTFTPMFTTKANTLLHGDWRQQFANGAYHVDLAGVFDKGDASSPANSDFRGSIKTSGRFALDPYWSWGWDVLADTDNTFRRYYRLDSSLDTDRVSQIYLEGLHGRNYASMRFYRTSNLLTDNDPTSKAWVLPEIDYDYYAPHPVLGGELSFTSNVMALNRDSGPNQDHGVLEANWRRQMIDPIGEVFTPFVQLRGDVYNIDNNSGGEQGGLARGNAMAGGEYSYPFVATTGNITSVIEPVAQIIFRPNSIGNQTGIPNEDAQSLIFDDTLLFETDKFSGYDRTQTGTTANAGLRYTATLPSGAYVRTVFGESYHLAGQNPFPENSGLATDASDYVAGIYIQANSALSFQAQSRFDQVTWQQRRTDLGANANYGPITFNVNYVDVPAEPGYTPDTVARSEIQSSGALAITDRWALLGNIRYDLDNNFTLQDGLGIRYQDDCFTLSLSYIKTNYTDLDVQPNEAFLVQFSLKYLGSYKFSPGGANLLTVN